MLLALSLVLENLQSTDDVKANAYAVRTLRAVEQKLQGVVGAGLPLSIEGQVQRLIHEATTSENLAKMYAGWMAWI